MIELRELTEQGIQQFEAYLRDLDNSKESTPKPDLNVRPFSNTLDLQEEIYIDENKTFKSRLDIGNYLHQKLSLVGVGRENVITEKQEQWMNVWTWLAYIWVNQFVPVRNGVHVVPAFSRFIGSNDWRARYKEAGLDHETIKKLCLCSVGSIDASLQKLGGNGGASINKYRSDSEDYCIEEFKKK